MQLVKGVYYFYKPSISFLGVTGGSTSTNQPKTSDEMGTETVTNLPTVDQTTNVVETTSSTESLHTTPKPIPLATVNPQTTSKPVLSTEGKSF